MDFKTASLIFGLVYTLLPIITWLILAHERKAEDLLWCGGGVISGLGICLGAFREHSWSYFLTVTIPYSLVFFGTLLKVQALRRELGRAWRPRHIAGISLSFLVIYELVRQRYGFGLAIYLLTEGGPYLILTAMLGLLGRELGRLTGARSALWLASAYWLLGAAMFLRLVYALISHEIMISDPPHYTANLVALTGIFTTVMSAIGYVGLRLEITGKQLIQARLEQAHQGFSRAFGERMAESQRQEIVEQIGVVLGHELKQPIGAIRLDSDFGSSLLEPTWPRKEELENVLSRIAKNANRAGALLDRFIQRTTHAERRPGALDLAEIVRNIVDLLLPQCQQHSIVVLYDKPAGACPIKGNELEIGQILVNLLKNAIEASAAADRHEVHITLTRGAQENDIRILDQGAGFDETTLPEVGKAFLSTKPEGLGLGLFIARELAARNQARLTFGNRAEGGAVAVLSFPVLNPIGQR